MRKSIFIFLTTVFLVSCVSEIYNNKFIGTYLEEDLVNEIEQRYKGDPEDKDWQQYKKNLGELRSSISITETELVVSRGNRVVFRSDYKIHEDFLVANDKNTYWVLFMKDSNTVVSTRTFFYRTEKN